MRFLILRRADAQTEQGVMPDEELLAAMGSYNQQLVDAGVMRGGEGIRPSAEGVRLVLGAGGESRIEHGPFPEPELVAGMSVFEADSREEAIEWIKRWPAQDGGGDTTIEIRESGCPDGCAEVRAAAAAGAGRRYIVLLRSSPALEAELPVGRERIDRLEAHNAAEAARGVLLAGDGLRASSRASRVRFKGGKPSVVDGPFTEIKELIAGYWLIRAASLDAAIEWARHNPYPTGPEVVVEIRPLYEMEDFAPAFTPELRAAEERMRAAQLEAGLHARLAGNAAGA
jgi:hypothetical protein